jgi:hypothetical protein
MIASSNGHTAVVRELLVRGADVNARSNDGRTALHAASYDGRAEAMRELLVLRPDINAQSGNGDTPLIEACSQGHLMAATILIGAGADLALLDNAGRSALVFAERCVAADEEGDEGVEALEGEDADAKRERLTARDKLHEQHRLIVALLKGQSAA